MLHLLRWLFRPVVLIAVSPVLVSAAALLRRPPSPLAVIGGGNSTWARRLAMSLRDAGAALPAESQPILLITTATADKVGDPGSPPDDAVPLTGAGDGDEYRPGIYEGRT